jgi:hypothetical protein
LIKGVFNGLGDRFFGGGAGLEPEDAGEGRVSISQADVNGGAVRALAARVYITRGFIKAAHRADKEKGKRSLTRTAWPAKE